MADGTGALIRPAAPRAGWAAALRAGSARLLRRRGARVLIAVHLVAAAIVPMREAGWLQGLELAAYDTMLRLHRAAPEPSGRVTIVAVTEEDIGRFGYPVRDDTLSAVIERVAAAGARVIGVDLYRDLPMPPGEADLAATVARHENLLWIRKLPDGTVRGIPAPPGLVGTPRAVLSDLVTDAGGVVRRGLLLATDPETGRNARTLGTALAERYLGGRLRAAEPGSLGLGAGRVQVVADGFGPFSAVDTAGYQTLLDWRGGHGRFPVIPFAAALDRPDLAEALRDRVVLVGVVAPSIKDSFATPFTTGTDGVALLPGIAVHAHLADQLIRLASGEDRSAWALPRAGDAALIWAAALLAAALGLLASRGALALLGLAGALAVLVAAAVWAFSLNLLLPAVPMALGLLGAAAAANLVLHGAGARERAQLRRSFEHYLDPRIVQDMLAGDELPSFGGENREITAVFTDVAGFTTLSEGLDAAEVASLLHDYFEELTEAVVAHGGLVNDFIADGLLALFGAPQRQDDHADRAVSAALALDVAGRRFAARQQARGVPFGETRIGVHSGIALVGNIGTRSRLKYGALGDVLNTASRLEGLNKYLGTRVCVSGDTQRLCRRHRFQQVGEVVVKGRSVALPVARPLMPDEAEPARYHALLAALRGGDPAAANGLAQLAAETPDDPLASLHARRAAAGETGTVLVMTEK